MLGLQEDKQNHNHQLWALGKAVAKHEEFPALSEASLILDRDTHRASMDWATVRDGRKQQQKFPNNEVREKARERNSHS